MSDLTINRDKILAEELIRINEKGLGYDEKFREFTEAISRYRETIEKEFTARDKRPTDISKDNPDLRFIERSQTLEGIVRERPTPNILGKTNEARFDDPERIEEL